MNLFGIFYIIFAFGVLIDLLGRVIYYAKTGDEAYKHQHWVWWRR